MDDSATVAGEQLVPVAALPPDLVTAVYRDLLQASFRPEELPGIEDFRRRYAGDDPQPSGVLLREGAAVGVYLCEAYAGGRALLLSHLAVSGRVRGGGIGGRPAAGDRGGGSGAIGPVPRLAGPTHPVVS